MKTKVSRENAPKTVKIRQFWAVLAMLLLTIWKSGKTGFWSVVGLQISSKNIPNPLLLLFCFKNGKNPFKLSDFSYFAKQRKSGILECRTGLLKSSIFSTFSITLSYFQCFPVFRIPFQTPSSQIVYISQYPINDEPPCAKSAQTKPISI